MNNPFSRLKHFTPDEIDPQENHATECLAACLVFSLRIREEFIKFLFRFDEKPFETGGPSEIEIVTQEWIGDGGYVDLVLRKPNVFTIAIEVKVKSPENCDHHRNQLKNYGTWLKNEAVVDTRLFTLVRDPDKNFCPEDYRAKRHCWRDLFKFFRDLEKSKENQLTDVESNLISNFCEYLESEGIVSTYETKDLLSYSAGLKARKAIIGIFNQVASRLETDAFKSLLVDGKKDSWPRLSIKHPDWKKIFGEGENLSISLWFRVPGIWDAKQHDFYFEIELWDEQQPNDWQFIKSKLPKWLEALKSQKFEWEVWRTWNNARGNIPAGEIKSQPKRIQAWKTPNETILDQNSPQREDELVNTLVNRTKQYAEIISSLEA
jgi:hypothetical protein